jgi:hypothetical protein
MTALPGTYRESDATPIDMEDAKQQWAVAARPELERVARTYGDLIKYGALAESLQAETGIRTGTLMHHWIGDVLGRVGAECHRRGEPLLSALCVHQDGTIGAGYGIVLAETYGGEVPEDLDLHSAEERLRCYRYFGADLPPDGGHAVLTTEVATRRRTAARRAREDAPKPVCPTCHIALPAVGGCYYCDG